MPKTQCYFLEEWLMNPDWKPWLSKHIVHGATNKNNGFCKFCHKVISVSNMGKQAIISHAKSVKHRAKIQNSFNNRPLCFTTGQQRKESEVTCNANNVPASVGSNISDSASSSMGGKSGFDNNNSTAGIEENVGRELAKNDTRTVMANYLVKDEVIKTEVLWSSYVVMNHLSLRNSADAVELFPLMFPGNKTAENLRLHKDKVSYIINYGLGSFFKSQLLSELQRASYIVTCFDESLNKISQEHQMDVAVRYWDVNQVKTRYLNSVFLGHTCAEDILTGFKNALQGITMEKILQISMDGPNVNLKFHRLFQEERLTENPDAPQLLNIGTCGLHVVHNAFKTGFNKSEWVVLEYLRASYNLFKNVPARRADFVNVTGTSTFPQKFCAIRWVENVDVVQKALKILPQIEKYVEATKKGEIINPKCKSFDLLVSCLETKVLAAQLSFFQTIAAELEPFLRRFQSNEPLVPFLFCELYTLVRNLMGKFVKESKLIESNTVKKLTSLDLSVESGNLREPKNVLLGFSTKQVLKDLINNKGVKDVEILRFKNQARQCLTTIVAKILEKSPLKYKLCQGLACLSPEGILKDGSGKKYLSQCLEVFVENNWITGLQADKILKEYGQMCSQDSVKEVFKEYDLKNSRLDTTFYSLLNGKKEYEKLLNFIKMCLILSHGNAEPERGFSINKEMLSDNQDKQSLVSQRLVYNGISEMGGVKNIVITKQMLNYVKNASQARKDALAKKRTEQEERKLKERARKLQENEIRDLTIKKQKILSDAIQSSLSIDSKIEELKKKA